jgi:hypothetical protein
MCWALNSTQAASELGRPLFLHFSESKMLCFSCVDPSPSFGAREKLLHLAPLSAQTAVVALFLCSRWQMLRGPANQEPLLLARNARTLFKSFWLTLQSNHAWLDKVSATASRVRLRHSVSSFSNSEQPSAHMSFVGAFASVPRIGIGRRQMHI